MYCMSSDVPFSLFLSFRKRNFYFSNDKKEEGGGGFISFFFSVRREENMNLKIILELRS